MSSGGELYCLGSVKVEACFCSCCRWMVLDLVFVFGIITLYQMQLALFN